MHPTTALTFRTSRSFTRGRCRLSRPLDPAVVLLRRVGQQYHGGTKTLCGREETLSDRIGAIEGEDVDLHACLSREVRVT
jgi:hypothetical protein